MATPFLVVVDASFRKVRASPRPHSRSATLKACWKPPGPPTMRDCSRFTRPLFLQPERATIFPDLCKNLQRGVGKEARAAPVANADPVSKQGVVKTGMAVA
ncbi:hypothetical protein [Paraburkholderia sp. JHI869]|uniref:hypothetical protein n=1 Tax=Paraburkholderia sp. JHI869 TaxID=3112959 RepID=UPI003177126F